MKFAGHCTPNHTEEGPASNQTRPNADAAIFDQTDDGLVFKLTTPDLFGFQAILDRALEQIVSPLSLFPSSIVIVVSSGRPNLRLCLVEELEKMMTCSMKAEKQFSLDREDMFKFLYFRRVDDHQEDYKTGLIKNGVRICRADFGYISERQELCKSISLIGKDFIGQRFCLTQLDLELSGGQNCSPLQHTLSNMWQKTNTLSSVNQEKLISPNRAYYLSSDNTESCAAIGIDSMEGVNWDGKTSSHWLDYCTCCNLNKHKETMRKDPTSQLDGTLNQRKRKETAQRLSSFSIFTIMSLWFLFTACSEPHLGAALVHVQPQRKQVSIRGPLLGLFGFMVVVWAVAMMILAGAQFTRLHSAILLFWAILMHFTPHI